MSGAHVIKRPVRIQSNIDRQQAIEYYKRHKKDHLKKVYENEVEVLYRTHAFVIGYIVQFDCMVVKEDCSIPKETIRLSHFDHVKINVIQTF